ncbi:putative histidine phosphotransferase hpt1p protein [Phaeoacremonium minimum UCRPA7]|uniref:Putative histidine phosphotransferase hpt1p protein n=1 Tax=Phaeoacremonium minimum (strain UCR-PA7) TaxID=1286976 RepID=R8BL37_PHAM7|nr:putative histidine phosphotransferase hpt1p protein [Phaeoacremonium minimum UCRPA7]EOO00064.1 putative histidine phosphotransferase hpt1p protein [Phaeoacremonium minimum UCRPA7]
MPDLGDNVDMATFSQILEMDESEDEREFSKPLVLGFFEQAEETFEKMDTALAAKNLNELSGLGHFLKGSSATLGFNKVRDSCQIIQQYGHKLTVDGAPEPDETVCLRKITEALKALKVDFEELEKQLNKFFSGNDANGT